MKILVLNGPNLNMLGKRETEIYGSKTLDEIKDECIKKGGELGIEISFRQTNKEYEIVEWIQQTDSDAIIINAAAYTHTSVAIYDALKNYKKPIIELHLSNTHAREEFRHKSYISPIASGIICGFGAKGYILAIEGLL